MIDKSTFVQLLCRSFSQQSFAICFKRPPPLDSVAPLKYNNIISFRFVGCFDLTFNACFTFSFVFLLLFYSLDAWKNSFLVLPPPVVWPRLALPGFSSVYFIFFWKFYRLIQFTHSNCTQNVAQKRGTEYFISFNLKLLFFYCSPFLWHANQ